MKAPTTVKQTLRRCAIAALIVLPFYATALYMGPYDPWGDAKPYPCAWDVLKTPEEIRSCPK